MYIFQPDRYLLQRQVKKYSHYIKGRVLDAGAGSFDRYKKLFEFTEYIKMDICNSENVDVVGSIEDIPFESNSFDSIICTQVLEHVKNPTLAAKELYRVLKNGGYALITVPQINELHEVPNDYFRYTNFGLKEIFEKQGFNIVECSQRGGFFTVLCQMKIRYLIDKFDLYKKPLLGKVFNKFIKMFSLLMMWFDKIDCSEANKKHTLGWCFVFKK